MLQFCELHFWGETHQVDILTAIMFVFADSGYDRLKNFEMSTHENLHSQKA